MLIKFAQRKEMFVFDFVNTIQLTQQELFMLHYDPFTKYQNSTFDDFKFFFILSNDTFPMNQLFDFNGGEKEMYNALLFVVGKQLIYQTNNDGFVGLEPITKDVLNKVVTKVKDECEGAY